MKVALGYKDGFKIEEIDIPKLGYGDVLMRVKACGICGSDVKSYRQNLEAWDGKPKRWGHEASGVVEKVGTGVKDFKMGDRVVIDPIVSCGYCKSCKLGYTNLCVNSKVIGCPFDGAFAEYIIIKSRSLYQIGDSVSFNEAALTEPLACAYYAVERSQAKSGEIAVVIGPGPIGLAMCMQLKIRGLKVILVGTRAERLNAGLKLGVDEVIDSTIEDPKKKIKYLTKGWGVDVVIEAVGKRETLQLAIEIGGKRSRVIIFGTPPAQEVLTLFPLELIFKDQELKAVCGAPSWVYPLVVNQLKEKLLDVKPIITHCFPLSMIQKAMDILLLRKERAIKIIINP